jgi:hypothetical protein
MHELLRDGAQRAHRSEQSLASWYAQGRSDGIGDRLLMFDNTGAPSLELLRFHAKWAAAPGFERSLRHRVDRLSRFEHPAFPHIRAVECLEGDNGLALVSTYTPGKRLSEMFHGPRLMGLHPAFATWLIRQLTPALAELQRQGLNVTHAALTPDRVVLTPDGSLVMLEHVLGSALDALRLPALRLWGEFGILAPPTNFDPAPLDARTDVVQLGLLALSVLLGRRITPADYPQNLRLLLDEFAETASRRSPALVPPLRAWLERALRPSADAFTCAEEAQDGLKELPDHGAPAAINEAPATGSAAPPRTRGLLVGQKSGNDEKLEGTMTKSVSGASDLPPSRSLRVHAARALGRRGAARAAARARSRNEALGDRRDVRAHRGSRGSGNRDAARRPRTIGVRGLACRRRIAHSGRYGAHRRARSRPDAASDATRQRHSLHPRREARACAAIR